MKLCTQCHAPKERSAFYKDPTSPDGLKTQCKECYCKNQMKHSKNTDRHITECHPTYHVWESMKARCDNPNEKGYKNYGGRGITVCEVWRNSFEEFEKWAIASGYLKGLTLDRRDNDGDYEPDNCRWVSWLVQAHNKRKR